MLFISTYQTAHIKVTFNNVTKLYVGSKLTKIIGTIRNKVKPSSHLQSRV